MKNEIKILVEVDLDANTKHAIHSLEKEGYEIISVVNSNDIQTYRIKRGIKTPTLRNNSKKENSLFLDNFSYSKDHHLTFISEPQYDYKKNIIKTKSNDVNLVEKACDFLTKEISEKHTLQNLSRELVTNRNTLSKAFKNILGLGVFSWLRQQRINKAASLLKNTSMHIQLISYEVGYNDPANFSTAFRKITGLSPKEYRNKHLKKNNQKRLLNNDLDISLKPNTRW